MAIANLVDPHVTFIFFSRFFKGKHILKPIYLLWKKRYASIQTLENTGGTTKDDMLYIYMVGGFSHLEKY
jgi:hypothetical protein